MSCRRQRQMCIRDSGRAAAPKAFGGEYNLPAGQEWQQGVSSGMQYQPKSRLGVMFADVIFILVAYYSTSRLLDKIKDDPNFLIFGGVLLVVYGFISFIKT